ncbi:hypothetical protein [Lundtoftevirus Lu221]|uniref:Uncharacterized protein n=1 Tax=phage PKM.Lu.22.1 TaxID=3049197 RepID=A0AAF0KYB0_9CAUD|nr:hypothetical protein [phage PKM.Lu.22.1]
MLIKLSSGNGAMIKADATYGRVMTCGHGYGLMKSIIKRLAFYTPTF